LTDIDALRYTLRMDTTLSPRSLPVEGADPADGCCTPTTAAPSLDAAHTLALADRLKALADPTRLGLLDLLAQQPGVLCVCELTARFDLHQPTISHHLRILRQAGLVTFEKRGVWAYYGATETGKQCLSLVRALA
jgi:ArsR family transcriptional regulator